MAKGKMIDVAIDLDVSNDVPPSIRYSDLSLEELETALEREIKANESLESWEKALEVGGLKI